MWANERITNHSARKSTVRKLKSFGFLKCEIKNITGHSSECGLDAYDSEMKMKRLQYLNVSTPPRLLLSSEHSKRNFSRTLYPTPVDNKNFSFRINWNNFSQSQLSKPLGTSSPGIFSFNGCQVNTNIDNSMQPQQNINAKRKRHII